MSELDTVPTWLRAALGTAVPEVFKLEQRAFEQVQQRRGLGRRAFLQSMTAAAAGLAVDPEQLIWTPTKRKNIILPVASEKGIAVATVHGTRYYMLLEVNGHTRRLFFDSGWRMLHAIETDSRGFLIVVPMVSPEQAMRMMATTGKTPIELGQMACQKHHGIYDHGHFTATYDGNTLVPMARTVYDFTVTEVAERMPLPMPTVPHDSAFDPLTMFPPQQEFRDLTPEETVRLVHDRQERIHRGDRVRRYRVPGIVGV